MSDAVDVVLARIETKLDTALTDVKDHEARIRRLERAQWMAAGAGMFGGGAIGAIASALIKFS